MAFNPFTIKKSIALIIPSVISISAYHVTLMATMNILNAILAGMITACLMYFLGSKLLAHPFLAMLEHKGIINWDINSTGMIGCFLGTRVQSDIKASYMKRNIKTTYTRDNITYITMPQKAPIHDVKVIDEKGIVLKTVKALILPATDVEKADKQFMLNGIPTMIYNSIIGEYMSKNTLSDFEQKSFIATPILNLKRSTEALSQDVHHLAKYVIREVSDQAGGWFARHKNIVITVIIIVMVLLILVMFAPQILNTLNFSGLPIGGGGGSPVQPRP